MARRKGPREIWAVALPSGMKIKVVNHCDYVELGEQSEQYLIAALETIPQGSPARRHIEAAMKELARGPGRPPVSKDEMVDYRKTHGTDAAMRRYNVTAGTLDKYERDLKKQRG